MEQVHGDINKKLKEAEEKYRILFEGSPNAIQLMDMKGNILDISSNVEEILGYSKEELVGKRISKLKIFSAEDWEKYFEAFISLRRGEKPKPIESIVYRKDGSPMWVRTLASLVKLKEETLIQLVHQDITELKEAEELLKELNIKLKKKVSKTTKELIESEETYRLISESANDLITIINEKAEYEYINESAHMRLLGYSKEDLIGKPVYEYLHPKDVKKAIKEFNHAAETGETGIELRIRNKDGKYRYIETRGRRFFKDGKPKGLLITRDITKRILAEQKLKESEKNYREAYDLAEFYKDIFTHDMNNILQNILLSAEIIVKNPSNLIRNKEVMDILKFNVERGADLILNIQKLSKLEKNAIPTVPVEIFPVLKLAIDYVAKNPLDKLINIEFDTEYEECIVQANDLLIDVFENILLNAVKYNDNEMVEIVIKTSKIKKNKKKYVKIEFIDNGIGIPDSRKKLIFKRIKREKKGAKGMGIGLSLVKTIVSNCGGEIFIEDKIPGDYTQGSNFIVLFPEVF